MKPAASVLRPMVVLAGAVAIAAPRLLTAACSDPFFDERTVYDLGRLAFSPCTTTDAIPWDQPPLANLGLYALDPLARALGVDAGRALDLPLVVGRLLVVAGAVVAWLTLRRGLWTGLPRAAFFVVCLLSAASLELSSLAMNNGIVVLPMVVALACFGGLGPRGRGGWALGGAALGLAAGTSYIAWPAAVGLGAGVLWILWRRQAGGGSLPWIEALLALGPAALVGASWLVVCLGQADYFDSRMALYQPRSWLEPAVAIWQTQRWFVFGRELHWAAGFSSGALALSSAGALAWLALAGAGTPIRRGDDDRWRRLGPVVVGLAWGTWVVVLALMPVVWLGKVKFFLLLLAPTAVLACRGLGVLLRSRRWSLRFAGTAAALTVAASLLVGALRDPVCWDRDYQKPRFYYPLPAAWTCADPWVSSLERAQDSERTLLPPSGRIVCEHGGPCVQEPEATAK